MNLCWVLDLEGLNLLSMQIMGTVYSGGLSVCRMVRRTAAVSTILRVNLLQLERVWYVTVDCNHLTELTECPSASSSLSRTT